VQRSREHAEQLIEQGLQWRDTPREIAATSDVVFTSVPDDAALEAVASGADGIIAGLQDGKIWVDVSTVSPELSRELAGRVRGRGAVMLDAPMSGSVPQVEAGTLTIMVGGDEAGYRAVEPLLRQLGTRTTSATTGWASRSSSRSTSAWPSRCSLSPKGCSWQSAPASTDSARWRSWRQARSAPRARASIILDPSEEAWFDISFMHKDIELALATARELGIPLPIAERASEVLEQAEALGYERRDLAALFQALEQIAGGAT
jgi:3-hydroxyisobutyrate dehydrogenase-like beta-hydroxyacid dehydrogenase